MSVSVVIPARDAERYLEAALASVAAQTCKANEVIVVDDGSTDGTVVVAQSFGGNVRCIRQEGAGAGAARNAGVSAATGTFVAFLDADDVWLPAKLERQLATFAGDDALDLVFGHMTEFVSPDCSRPMRRRLGLLPGHCASSLLARSDSVARVGPFATHLRAGEFIDWIARARVAGLREGTITDHVVARRIHGANTSLRDPEALHDLPRVLKTALDRRRAE